MVRFRQGAVPEPGAKAPCPGLRRKGRNWADVFQGYGERPDADDDGTRAYKRAWKAGFFFLGFLGGIVGILAASLMNINAPYRPEGTKMAALGFATACVLGTLIALVGFIALLGAR